MRFLASRELKELAVAPNSKVVSIYIPTSKVWSQNKKNEIKLKNLIKEAEKRLKQEKVTASVIKSTLDPLKEVITYNEFWKEHKNGLAIFAHVGNLLMFKIPYSPPAKVYIENDFVLNPLKDNLFTNLEYYLLLLSKNRVDLYKCNNKIYHNVANTQLPTSMEKALEMDNPEKSIQHHTGKSPTAKTRSGSIFHGQGKHKDVKTTNLKRFLQKVDSALTSIVYYEQPLVVAATKTLYNTFVNVSNHPTIVNEFIKGNPDLKTPRELVVKAFKLAKNATSVFQ